MRKICFSALFILLLTSTLCFADTIHVPGDQPTIEAGIDAASNGDTVLVAPGTYYENSIYVYGKVVHIKSSGGPEVTVIDGENYYRILAFAGWQVQGSVLEGFTITNGGSSSTSIGGGIRCTDCGITIQNNIISNCTTDQNGQGGGIGCSDASVIIENNLICNNYARIGAGIYCGGYDCVPRIRYNTIINNTAGDPGVYVGDGGGIGVRDHSTCIIHGNIIKGNMSASGGGGIQVFYANADIVGNIIADNYAESTGGGIYCSGYPDMRIAENMIYGNRADYGGGIYLYANNPEPLFMNNTIFSNHALTHGGGMRLYHVEGCISNTILWNNTAPEGNELYISDTFQREVKISHSNLEGGMSSVALTGLECELVWGDGMIDADPLFVDPLVRDFHLTYDSPCRDSGDNSVITQLIDFESDPRIAYGVVDIGADEFYTHYYCTGDFSPSGSIDGKFIGLPGTTPVGLFIGSGIMDLPLQHKWGEFYLEAPWLLFPLVPIPAGGVSIIPATLPSTSAPYDIPMQALIGWELSNLFVLEIR